MKDTRQLDLDLEVHGKERLTPLESIRELRYNSCPSELEPQVVSSPIRFSI